MPRGSSILIAMTISTETVINAMHAGLFHEAEAMCRAGLSEDPDDSDLRFLLALGLQQQGRQSEALETYGELTGRFPDEALHWGNYATALRDVGRQEEAATAYSRALQLEPQNFDQLFNLGILQLQMQEYLSARDNLLKAHDIDPGSPSARIQAARACSICRDYRTDELIRPWREWLPLDDAQQLDLADLHLLLGDANTAKFLLEDILSRTPDHWRARLLLAAVLERVNQLDIAEAMLDQVEALRDAEDSTTAIEIAQQRGKLALRRGNLTLAREMLERAGPRRPDDYAYFFVLAEVCDKLGDNAGALSALESAHAKQIDELKHSVPYRFETGAPILPAAVGEVSVEDYQRWPNLQAPDGEFSPIFIVGFPRSGTTLLEQMLDAHPKLQSMDERPFFNILGDQLDDAGLQMPSDIYKLDQRTCDELRKGYLTLVSSKITRRWDTQLVDKNPLNMLWLPMIHRLFPKAKFILALRHPCDVILSNYMQNFRSSVLALACASLPRVAEAYVKAMESWLYHVEVFKPDLFVSRYEELVADPALQAKRIGDFLGLSDATALLHFDQHARDKGYIATPSYTQVIQPVNRKGLDRWLRYREAMEPAIEILQPMLDYWGYLTERRS
jgi:Tfp pilus assembly protein PilF